MLHFHSFKFQVLLATTALISSGGCSLKADAPEGLAVKRPGVPLVRNQTYRILALGDSITRGSSEGLGNYRRPLQSLLMRGVYKFEFVGTNTEQSDNYHGKDSEQLFSPYQPLHEGYGGLRIEQIASEEPTPDDGGVTYPGLSTALKGASPDVVLMMLGTNDVTQNFDPEGSNGYAGQTGFAADAAARMDALVTRIHELSPETTLVLATITPIRDEGRQAKVREYNAFIERIVASHKGKGEKIVLADMGEALDATDLAGDGVHPSTEGYNKMASVWFAAMTEHKSAAKK